MEVIQCNNLKENRDKLIEVKNLDPEFSYNFKDDRLFFLVSKNRIYGYSIVKLNENAAELKRIFINPRFRNNGYGTILLKNIINWLIKNSCDKIIVKNHKKINHVVYNKFQLLQFYYLKL